MRIVNIQYYAHMAWCRYSVHVHDLLTWSYLEQGQLMELNVWGVNDAHSFGVDSPPPHHLITSWGGSR
jgi:hypothetical protein